LQIFGKFAKKFFPDDEEIKKHEGEGRTEGIKMKYQSQHFLTLPSSYSQCDECERGTESEHSCQQQ
jgi:hypothetical protein